MNKVCVIKAGSAVVTQTSGSLDFNTLASLCRQIAVIHEKGWKPVLVTSGAVASGRGFLFEQAGRKTEKAGRKTEKELTSRSYAALGQSRLLSFYTDMLESHNVPLRSAQILLTREAFSNRERYTALRDTLLEMIEADILPIINNNDVLNVQSLDFTDNDQLAAYVAGMLDANILILLSDIDGVYTDNPKVNSDAHKIEMLSAEPEMWPAVTVNDAHSSSGGMNSKLSAFKLMSSLGIRGYIARGKGDDTIQRILLDNDLSAGTYLEPRKNAKVDTYRRWLATGATPEGIIVVSNLGADALRRREHRASLLAAGIEGVYGRFDQDAIVAVRDENFDLLGIGKSKYSSQQLGVDELRAQDMDVIHANFFLGAKEGLFANAERSLIKSLVADWRKKEGYECSTANMCITVTKSVDNKTQLYIKFEGAEARKLFERARMAADKIGVTNAEWILFETIEGT